MQFGPDQADAELAGAGAQLFLQLLAVADPRFGEPCGEEVNRADLFAPRILKQIKHAGRGDRADHVVNRTGDVDQPGVSRQPIDLGRLRIDRIDR